MGNLKDCIAVLESGSRDKGGAVSEGIPSLGAEHLNSSGGFNLDATKLKYVSRKHFVGMKTGKIVKSDVLVVKDGATTGKTSYVGKDFPFDEAAINEHVFLLRTKDNIISKYLFYYLRSDIGQECILNDFRGATVGGISRNFIDMPIPLPPLSVQRQIADVLDRASALVEARKAQIAKLDLLVKSRFVEMFGASTGFKKELLASNVQEMFIGPFGSSLKNDSFVSKSEGFCIVYEQKHAIEKTMQVPTRYVAKKKYQDRLSKKCLNTC